MDSLITTQQIFLPQTRKEGYFSDFAFDYINKLENGTILTNKKVRFSESTIKIYRAAMDYFIELEKLLPERITINQINRTVLLGYERFLISKDITLNTVSVYLAKIKAICNVLLDNEVIVGNFKSVKTTTEESTQVALSEKEITKMKQVDLTKSEEYILDIWLCAAFTGMRISTLKKFLKNPFAYIKEYEGFSYIDIVADKTNEQSVIPLHIEVFEVISKNPEGFKIPTDQHLRRVIKSIAKRAGIDNPTPKRTSKRGELIEEIVPKYELVSLHTGRRSFITNIRKHISNNNTVMAMSGHKSESRLKTYDRSLKLDKIISVLDHDFFRNKI